MFVTALAADAARIQACLDAVLAQRAEIPLVHAMRYAVQGGKRLRGFLVMEGARLHGVPEAGAVVAAAAVEAMHAYSLVHDDLPAMDDDALRRGQPTVHVKWDEAVAVLAGDALQALAFEMLAEPVIGGADVRLALISGMGRAAGAGPARYRPLVAMRKRK